MSAGCKRWSLNLSLTLAVIVIFSLAGEVLTRFSGYYSFDPVAATSDNEAQKFSEPYMVRSQIPGLLFELKKGAYANNSRGFRGPEIADIKTRRRIIALGDSVTNGFLAGPAVNSWPYLLDQLYAGAGQSVEVINEGIIGYNTEQEAIHFRHFGIDTDPDLVILGFTVANDFDEKLLVDSATGAVNAEPVKKYSGDVIVQIVPRPRVFFRARFLPASWEDTLFHRSHFYRFLNDRIAGLGARAESFEVGKEKSLKALADLNDSLKARGIPLYVVLFPSTAYPFDQYPDDLKSRHRELGEFLTKRGIPYRDYIFLLKDHAVEKIRKDAYCHFNVDGNRIIAEEIFNDVGTRFLEYLVKPME